MLATNIAQDTPPTLMDMRIRQAPLRKAYVSRPDEAWIIDCARTSSDDVLADAPVHGTVVFGSGRPVTLATGVHSKVGGFCDLPNPGEVLAAAIASCLDASIRIVANLCRVRLTRLDVSVEAGVDVRGTLKVDSDVPVGFQDIVVSVRIDAGESVSRAQLEQIVRAGEDACVVLQTLRRAPDITVQTV